MAKKANISVFCSFQNKVKPENKERRQQERGVHQSQRKTH
jgi:hypothetical protein